MDKSILWQAKTAIDYRYLKKYNRRATASEIAKELKQSIKDIQNPEFTFDPMDLYSIL